MNGEDQALGFISAMLMLVLVGSALLARRIPMGQAMKMITAWVLIFAAAFLAFTVKDELKALGSRVLAEVRGEDGNVVQAGETLRIKQSEDGHFWVDGELNGEKLRFLVDSGATITSISADDAERAGVTASGMFPTLVNTANGTISVRRARAETLAIGTIERRGLALHVSEAFGDTNVLGMNFLSSLSAWGVEGQWLVLKP